MNEQIIAIDFAPGMHGHFLEYVINRFIYNVPHTIDNIFQKTGAAHRINHDPVYRLNKAVTRGHYSFFGNDYPKTVQQVIWIEPCKRLDFALLVNVFERCSPEAAIDDVNAENIKKLQLDFMSSNGTSELELRQNWYAKLKEYHNEKISLTKKETDLPVFDFDYESFFSLSDFLEELDKTASFLSMTLKFDLELVKLWQQFIDKNLGYQLHNKANDLLDKIISNTHDTIESDWRLHAYLNFRISEIFRLHDGILFEQEEYPTTTVEIHDLIVKHIIDYDLKF